MQSKETGPSQASAHNAVQSDLDGQFGEESLHVAESERRGWWPIACIWIGNAFNVSTLMTGAVLGAGLVLSDAFLAAFIGFGIVVAYMCFVAMESVDVGLPTSAMSTASLGKAGGRYLISLIIGISLIGWFGVQAAVCGASFSIMAADLVGFEIPVWASSVFWGVLMLATAVVGFDGVKWVNYVAAPLRCSTTCPPRVSAWCPASASLSASSPSAAPRSATSRATPKTARAACCPASSACFPPT